jgi:hypothetical protein
MSNSIGCPQRTCTQTEDDCDSRDEQKGSLLLVQHVLHSHAQERRVSTATKQCFTVTSRCFTNGGGQGYTHRITIYVQCRHCSTRGDSQRICRASSEEHGCTEAESDGSIGRVHEPWSKHHSAKPFGVQHDFLGFAFRSKISEMMVVMWRS